MTGPMARAGVVCHVEQAREVGAIGHVVQERIQIELPLRHMGGLQGLRR